MELDALVLDSPPAATRADAAASARFDRLAWRAAVAYGLCAVVATVLFVVVAVPHMPAMDAPAPLRAAFIADMAGQPLYRATSYLFELQMLPFLCFLGGLFTLMRHHEQGSGAISYTVFGAGVALAPMVPLMVLVEDHLMLGFATAHIDPVIVTQLDGFGPLAFALAGLPRAVILLGVAAVLVPARVLPRWIGAFGIGVAALGLLGTGTLQNGAFFPASHLATLLFNLWTIAVGVALARRGRR